jgi:peptidoglycan/xylan/chitin deacetylase (PgdA/CDA1 family)
MKPIMRCYRLCLIPGVLLIWLACTKEPVSAPILSVTEPACACPRDGRIPLQPGDSHLYHKDGVSIRRIQRGGTAIQQPTRWQDNKKAAYTIAFDDSRPSHFQVVLPELLKRGISGTFYLNTKVIKRWVPWQYMAEMGQEIGSHTWSHVRCSSLTEASFRQELKLAIADLEQHILDVSPVRSFSFPFAAFNDMNKRVIREYHLSARCGGGINSNTITDKELNSLKGIGIYPPYDIDKINSYVDMAIKSGGWIILYFHSVSAKEETSNEKIPLSLFKKHLDYVCSLRDSLWIAPQGDVAEFIQAREPAK